MKLQKASHIPYPQLDKARQYSPQMLAIPAPEQSLLYLQRTIGNQAVQRYLNRPIDAANLQVTPQKGAGTMLQRSWESEQLDSRVEAKAVSEVSAQCGLQKRKITYQTKDKKPTDPLGSTASHLTIEYAVDAETGQVTLGCMQPEYTITIFKPYVTSDNFVEKFTPLMEKYWNKYDGDMQKFSEDHAVGNFNYYDQTLRHEQKHADSRNLALMDLMPQYKRFLKDFDGLTKGEAHFIDLTNRYWKTAWDEGAENTIKHERIHYLDAVEMVEEYQRRVGDEPPTKSWGEQVNDTINEGISSALGGLFGW